MERDDYALGASKVFMRENLETVLEKHRQDIQEVNTYILIFQHFQGKNQHFSYSSYLVSNAENGM